MCRKTTSQGLRLAAVTLAANLTVSAQTAALRNQPFQPDWRRLGNSAVEFALASVATGPVERVWFSADGTGLFAKTQSGRVFETSDYETWVVRQNVAPPAEEEFAPRMWPEAGAKVRAQGGNRVRLYAVGRNAYRSDDGGSSWTNLTGYKQGSILGAGLYDAAASPRDPDEIVVCGRYGVWRSMDGGLSWMGLNQSLPNLPVRRLVGLPGGSRGMRVVVDGLEPGLASAVEWAPGEKQAWRPVEDSQWAQELGARAQLSRSLNAAVTAVAASGTFVYAGSADGRLWASSDQGRTWMPFHQVAGGAIESIWVDPKDSRLALAAGGRVYRTMNGGLWWDDLTANLADNPIHAVAADRASGAVYAATDQGVFLTFTDLNAAAPATPWASLNGSLPAARAFDLKLDAAGNQLFVGLDGYGVFSAIAPHRFRDLRVVNAADLSSRPAAPGALLSVLGRRIRAARAGNLTVPVLDASETESQIQVPFEVRGTSLELALEASAGRITMGVPLERVSPAVFIDPDGTPFLLDAETGVRLDALTPARSGSRIQVLATGLGRVQPHWPTGLAAPLENVPSVVAPVRAYLNRTPVEVTRATLAPGYIGFYLIEVQLPEILNAGPAELHVESDGRESNRVRVYVEQ